MCEVGRRKGALWDQGWGESGGAGDNGSGGSGGLCVPGHGHATRAQRASYEFLSSMATSPSPPSRRFGRAPNSLARPPFSHGFTILFPSRLCHTESPQKKPRNGKKQMTLCFDVPMTRRERH